MTPLVLLSFWAQESRRLYRARLGQSVAAALLVAGVAGCACSPEIQVTGETVKRPEGQPPPSESAFMASDRVSLRAVRGETLGLQVFVRAETAIRLDIPVEGVDVSAFQVGHVTVREPSTSMYGASTGAGRYPDVLRPAEQPVTSDRLAYFDVRVSRRAEAGARRGVLSVGKSRLPVDLRIEAVTIEPEADPLVWVFYHPDQLARAHGLPAGQDSPELVAIEAGYHRLFRQHAAYLASNLEPSRFDARRQFVHDVRYWPVAVDTSNDRTVRRDVARWLRLFRHSKVTPFTIPIDEPRSRAEKSRAARIARIIGEAGGGAPGLLRGVTAEVDSLYDPFIDVYLSPENIPRPASNRTRQRFWTYNGRPPQAGSMIVDTTGPALRTWGWLAFRYDLELWHAWEGLYFSDRYNDGALTNVFDTPLTFDERTRGGEDFGNGDGLLAYPGALPSLRLKALRRGLLDRLLLTKLSDCGGEKTARQIARETVPRGLGEATGDSSWPERELEWERARQRVLDALVRRCPRDV